MDELILRTLVIRFDGRVVEILKNRADLGVRMHVAFIKEPAISPPNRNGACTVLLAGSTFSVDADEMEPCARSWTRSLRPSAPSQPAASVREDLRCSPFRTYCGK